VTKFHHQQLASEQEKSILGLKIELLKEKIPEIEVSEMKAFEESLMLESWTRQLELDNLKMQSELDRIRCSIQDGETGNLKPVVLQDEVLRLVDALYDWNRRWEGHSYLQKFQHTHLSSFKYTRSRFRFRRQMLNRHSSKLFGKLGNVITN